MLLYINKNEQRGDHMNFEMKNIGDGTLLSEINLAGTHNTCTKNVHAAYVTKCHDLTVSEQLALGIRYLDIRIEKCGNALKTVHSVIDCRTKKFSREKLMFDSVTADCKAFLKANPAETLIMCIKRDDGAGSEETFDTLYENYIKNDDVFFTENRIPTLGEVRGKIVFLNRSSIDKNNPAYTDKTAGLNLSCWADQTGPEPREAEKVPIPSRGGDDTGIAFYLQDMYQLSPENKWYKAVLPLLENAPENALVINFFSANNIIFSPRHYAKYILKRFYDIKLEKGKKYGWLILDYPTEKAVKMIFETNP